MTFLVKNLSRAIVIGLLLPCIAFAQSAQWNLSQLSHSLGSGGVVPTTKGGTGLTTLTANDCLAVNSAGTAIVFQACGSGGGAVSSVSGDGALYTNSSSTGGVTLTLGNTGLAYGVWGGITGASGAPAYHSLSSYPVAAFPTLNQNTTGTAANITATSNSTLTTLSALSLPQSQVTGLGTFATQNYATPPAIGGTTPAAGAFTTLSASGQLTSTVATGTAPLVVASTTQVANLQAATAGALAATPTQCSGSGSLATGIAASGNANCHTLANADLPASGVIAGNYTATNITVNAQGIVTAAANGTASASSVTPGTTTVVGATAPCILDNSATTVMGCATLQGLAINSGVIGPSAATSTFTASHTVASTEMGGQDVMNVSGGGTLTIPAIGSGVFGAGQSLSVVNYSASTLAISTTPTVNAGGGCVSATGIPSGDSWQLLSNGTTLDCIQTISASAGSPAFNAIGSGTNANTLLMSSAGVFGLLGTSTGYVALASADTGATNFTATFPANTGTVAELNVSQTFTGTNTVGGLRINGTPQASAALLNMSTGVFTGGTGTTTWPALYMDPGVTAPTTFSTAGTFFGINAASGFTGNFFDLYVNGVNKASLTAAGALTVTSCTGCGSGTGTVTDGSGTTTANQLLLSTTTAHAYSVGAVNSTALAVLQDTTAITVSGCTPSASSLAPTTGGTITQPATACTTATFTFAVTAPHGWHCSMGDITQTNAGTYIPTWVESSSTATTCVVKIPAAAQVASDQLSLQSSWY